MKILLVGEVLAIGDQNTTNYQENLIFFLQLIKKVYQLYTVHVSVTVDTFSIMSDNYFMKL